VELVPVVLLVLLAVAVGGVFLWWQREREHRIREAIDALLARDPRWQRTTTLCGWTAEQLADRTVATPKGDRRYGLEHLVSGPLTIPVQDRELVCTATCGHWWSEVRHTTTDSKGHTSTTYQREDIPVIGVDLPGTVPADITIVPASVLGRLGVTRGGEQLESDGFNRRFRVEGGDRTLTVQLLDARLQQHLLERFSGRRLGLTGGLLVLGGDPNERDARLYGPIRDLPGLQQDAIELLSHVPPQFWRAIGANP
jgi:hypothetical protein